MRKAIAALLGFFPFLLFSFGSSMKLQVQADDGHQSKEQTKAQQITTEDQRKLVDEARRFASAVAKEDSPDYYRTLEENLFRLKVSRFGQRIAVPEALRAAPNATPSFSDLRTRIRAETANRASIYNDPTWQTNYRKWLSLPSDEPLRIIGGGPVAVGEYRDCVAVGSESGFCCTGTLIGKNVVLTAAHCAAGGCASRIYIGNNSNQPGTGRIINVKKDNGKPIVIVHEDYNWFTNRNDLAILILDDEVNDVPPRKIATTNEVNASFYLKLSGFGYTDSALRDYGIKNKVDVIVASNACDTQSAQERYGCNDNLEIVAGGNGVDSCNGDSGGPAYILSDGEVKLAGVVSRATRNSSNPCGDGGVYVRVDRFATEWIIPKAKASGGVIE